MEDEAQKHVRTKSDYLMPGHSNVKILNVKKQNRIKIFYLI